MTKLGAVLLTALGWGLRYPGGRGQWIVLILWVLMLAGGTVVFGDLIATRTNRDSNLQDQGAYLRIAEQSLETWWPTATDGVRNPLFPWLLARIMGDQPEAIFVEGQRLNVRLGALLIAGLGWWAGRRLAWLPAMTFVTIATAVVLPLSTYAGAEVLFYGLMFAGWMQALALFDRLTLPRCMVFGATLALAYLAKPGVTLLTGCFVVVGLVYWRHAARSSDPKGWTGFRPLTGAALASVVFSLMILPRALDAKEKFGDPLQNTAQFCFWADSWDEVFPVGAFLNPRFIHRIPVESRPSAARFFARHGWEGAWNRLAQGFFIQLDNVFAADRKSVWFERPPSAKRPVRRIFPYRGFFLLPPLAIAVSLWFVARRRLGVNPMGPAAPWQAAFALLLIVATVGAFSWYAAIASGSRFVMALYLPILASLLVSAEALRRRLAARWTDCVAGGAWLVMLIAMAAHLGLIVTHPFFDRLKGAF